MGHIDLLANLEWGWASFLPIQQGVSRVSFLVPWPCHLRMKPSQVSRGVEGCVRGLGLDETKDEFAPERVLAQ